MEKMAAEFAGTLPPLRGRLVPANSAATTPVAPRGRHFRKNDCSSNAALRRWRGCCRNRPGVEAQRASCRRADCGNKINPTNTAQLPLQPTIPTR